MTVALLLAAAASAKALPPAPLDFGAATMTIEPKDNRTRLQGEVWLKRTDLHVTGDRALAEFAQKPAAPAPSRAVKKKAKGKKPPPPPPPAEQGSQQTLERFTVDGAVHVERPGPQLTPPGSRMRTADGDHAVYDSPAQTLLLIGPPGRPVAGLTAPTGPVLRDGGELMVGERVLMHLDTDEVDVTRPRLWLKRSLPGVAEEKDPKQAQPMRVEAGALRLDQQRKVARFRDKVVLHRGDVTVRGPRMDARYDDKGELTTLQLRGGVVMVDGDRRAVGKQADYDAKTRLLVLTGDPKLFDRGDVLRGDRIEMALDTREVKVDKATGRVRPEQHKDEQRAGGKP